MSPATTSRKAKPRLSARMLKRTLAIGRSFVDTIRRPGFRAEMATRGCQECGGIPDWFVWYELASMRGMVFQRLLCDSCWRPRRERLRESDSPAFMYDLWCRAPVEDEDSGA